MAQHGHEYGWDESVGPTMAKHFQTWGFFPRLFMIPVNRLTRHISAVVVVV